jgi:copper chaperone
MTTLLVPDLSCSHCKATVEAALATIPQTGTVTVDLGNRTVQVSGTAETATLIRALDKVGYPATVA